MVAVKIRIRRPSRFGIQAICIMSIWGVPDLSTRPRALRALGSRDKSDTPRIERLQEAWLNRNGHFGAQPTRLTQVKISFREE